MLGLARRSGLLLPRCFSAARQHLGESSLVPARATPLVTTRHLGDAPTPVTPIPLVTTRHLGTQTPQIDQGTVENESIDPEKQGISVREQGVFDGTRLVLHHESRDLCRCPECWGATSNQPLHTKDFSKVKVAGVEEVQEHYIKLTWDDGHTGLLPRTQTGAYGNGIKPAPTQEYYDLSLRKNSVQVFWDKPDSAVYKQFEYGSVVSSTTQTREFLAHFMKYGIAFVSGCPSEPGDLRRITEEMGVLPRWDNLFGVFSRVSFQRDPVNQAFNNQYLELHTDIPYYTQTPSAYFFHCVANELDGGESFWADTFSAVQHIRDTHPDMFALLCSVKVPFRQYRVGWHLAGSYPTVEYMGEDMYRVRDCGFVIDRYQFVRDYDLETRQEWWKAYLYLRGVMNDTTRHVKTKLKSGDMVVIDNWRVQHGRDSFTVTEEDEGKKRIMDVCYVEWTHVQNKLLKRDDE